MENNTKISGFFMILFLGCAALLATTAVMEAHGKTSLKGISEVIQGKWMTPYEGVFNKALYISNFSKNTWGVINYVLFRQGNDGVIIGDQNWLFTSEEFSDQPARDLRKQETLNFIKAVHNTLTAHNTEILVVPVPSKSRIYDDKLGNYHFPDYKSGAYIEFISDLKVIGIHTLDVLSPMERQAKSEKLFLETDTHWTSKGSSLTARLAAAYIHKNFSRLSIKKVKFNTVLSETQKYEGDLMRYVPVGMLAPYIGPATEELDIMMTIKADENASTDTASLLFSDDAPAVTLVGTSYSANPNWNFEGYLKEYLQADILNMAAEGLGPFETMQKYLTGKTFKETPPKLIIWEIPERYILSTSKIQIGLSQKEI